MPCCPPGQVTGRESEIGFHDDPDLYTSYKKKSIKNFVDYATNKPWFLSDAVEALGNMYFEPRVTGSDVARIQEVFEIAHELDLFRCYPEHKIAGKIAQISRKVGVKACLELVLRAENQITATGDCLFYSMMGNRVTDDYHDILFPTCSLNPKTCMDALLNISLVPPRTLKNGAAHIPSKLSAAMPPSAAPVSSAANAVFDRTLRTSLFVSHYDQTQVPQYQDELMGAVRKLLTKYAETHGMPKEEVSAYFERVQKNAIKAGKGEMFSSKSIPFIAVRLWTTAERLGGKIELCSIINRGIVADDAQLMENIAIFVRAINMHCVCRHIGKPVKWPMTNMTHRGASMPREYQTFFTVGKKFRVPMFLATSADDEIAENFLPQAPATAGQQPPFQEPIMWHFHLDPVKRCKNVNFIDRTDNTVKGEKEFLFTPYSTFTVRSIKWNPSPSITLNEYHEIHVDVSPDNAREPTTLPLAPWA